MQGKPLWQGGKTGVGETPVGVGGHTTGRKVERSEQEPWEVVALFSSVNRSLATTRVYLEIICKVK